MTGWQMNRGKKNKKNKSSFCKNFKRMLCNNNNNNNSKVAVAL